MCLVVFAWDPGAERRLVLVGNRDEFHARPTAPMEWWGEPPMLAGRDLLAGGTWLAVDAAGRFGVLTNFRGSAGPADAPSRGTLIPRFLAGSYSPGEFLDGVAREAGRYAGFSLLLGDRHELAYFSNGERAPPRRLGGGTYGLSNGLLDSPWPKVMQSRARLGAQLAIAKAPEHLLDVLADRRVAPDDGLPDTGATRELERRLSAPFIVGEDYGTRSSSVLWLHGDGSGVALERSHGRDGEPTALRRFEIGARS